MAREGGEGGEGRVCPNHHHFLYWAAWAVKTPCSLHLWNPSGLFKTSPQRRFSWMTYEIFEKGGGEENLRKCFFCLFINSSVQFSFPEKFINCSLKSLLCKRLSFHSFLLFLGGREGKGVDAGASFTQSILCFVFIYDSIRSDCTTERVILTLMM